MTLFYISMKQNKTLGMMGFLLNFMLFCGQIFLTFCLTQTNSPLNIKNYRPISLLTVIDYEIFAKVLANPLNSVFIN